MTTHMHGRFLIILLLLFIYSCQTSVKGYLKHDAKVEKLSGNCDNLIDGVQVEANIIGERYEFQKCLNASGNYHYTVVNENDTLKVFFKPPTGTTALYKVVLDVQTEPAYKYVSIDGSTFTVTISR